LKELQGQLGDYNMLMDKINTNNDLDGVETQCEILKSSNQRETHVLDDIFIQRQQYILVI
jgi:intraflagellar transport protein 74